MDARYITSAMKPEQLPVYDQPEIAFIGRSNCGKSTLLNGLMARKGLARESRTPGRTQMVNFFSLNNKLIFADLPGYGFSVAKSEVVDQWQPLMDAYFRRPNIREFLFLMDSRREADDEDLALMYMLGRQLPITLILTKADKMNNREKQQKLHKMKTLLEEKGVSFDLILAVSSLKKVGVDELRKRVMRHIET